MISAQNLRFSNDMPAFHSTLQTICAEHRAVSFVSLLWKNVPMTDLREKNIKNSFKSEYLATLG